MEMSKDQYEDLLLRFAKELRDTGVTDAMKKLVEDQYNRTPNLSSVSSEDVTDRFIYRHEGYMIESTRTVKLEIKKCK